MGGFRRSSCNGYLPVRAALVSLFIVALLAGEGRAQSCTGDCNGDSRVELDELIRAVNVALGTLTIDSCSALARNGGTGVGIDDLLQAVAGAMSGCERSEGRDAVEGATRSAKTTLDALPRFFVFDFGRAGPGSGAQVASGGGAGGAAVRCPNGGQRTDACRDGGNGSSARDTVYSNCRTVEDGIIVIRDGMQRLEVAAPNCPVDPPTTVPLTLTLQAYRETRQRGSIELRSLEVRGTLVERFEPASGSCTADGAGFQNGTLTVDGSAWLTCNTAGDPTCDPSLSDLQVTAQGLFLQQTFAEPACDRTLLATGQLVVRNDAAGEDFSQNFDGLSMAESADGEALRIALNGRVFVDCIGPVEFVSKQEIVAPADTFCPASGALDVILGNAFDAGGADAGGGGADSFERPPSASEGGLREYTLRGANGAVYQVLQNPAGNTELGGEDVRITTLVGSTEPPCSSDSVTGARVGVARGQVFAADHVLVSPTVLQAATPCFNPNGADGDGLVCIPDDGDCGEDCRCPRGGCLTFTIADGLPFTGAPFSARVVDLPGSCDTIAAPSAFAFGTNTPTTETTQCAARPADGFTLARGRSIILAYDAAPAIAFATATGGFSIDTDGRSVRCPGTGGVLTGIAFKSELGPARVTFEAGSVAFDINADRVVDRELSSCQQLSLAACGEPSPTPTATPIVAPRCLAPGNLTSPVESSTSDRNNIVSGASCGDGGNRAPDRAFRFVPPSTGCYRVDTLDKAGLAAPYDTLVYVRRGADDCNGPELACNDNADAATAQSALLVQLTGGEAVAIVVDGVAGAAGDFRLQVEKSGPDCGTATPTPTSTQTATMPTPTETPTGQPSPTSTPSPSITATTTATDTPEGTSTPTITITKTSTPTPSATSSATPSATRTVTPTSASTPILGSGVFGPASSYKVVREPRALVAGRFFGDTNVDLAVVNADSNDVSILRGNGDGTFQSAEGVAVGTRPMSIVAADFDQDEKLDLAITNSGSDDVTVLLDNDDGTFRALPSIAVGSRPMSIVADDFNQDGLTDLAVANFGSNDVSILLGQGDANFDSLTRSTLGSCPLAITVGLLDADQYPDLAVANFDTSDVSILLGDAEGSFSSLPTRLGVATAPSSVVVGNFDGNAPLDLVAFGRSAGSFYPGNGDGSFGNRRTISSDLLAAYAAVGDFDHDTNLDLALVNFYGSVLVLFGSGNGTFQPSFDEYPVDSHPVFVAAADLDHDSDLDLAVTNSTSNNVSILLNEPSATETPTPTETPTVEEVTPGPEPVGEVVDKVSSERSSSLLVFPRVVANDTEDTTILIENGSNSIVSARCFYLNASPLSPEEPAGPANPPLWQSTDFKISLIRQQPTHWVASRGRGKDPTDPACSAQRLDCDGAGIDPGQVPPVADFIGELLCVETDSEGFPLAGNHLSGRAVIENVATGDASSYNGLGLQANDLLNQDNTLCIGTSLGCSAELVGCPDEWILTHAADGTEDPKFGPGSVSTTRLTVVPCSQNFENQIPSRVTLQFLITNEFEQRFSGSTSVECWGELALGEVTDIFTGATTGSNYFQTKIVATGSSGFFVVGESLRELDGRKTSTMTNLQVGGEQAEGDRLILPFK